MLSVIILDSKSSARLPQPQILNLNLLARYIKIKHPGNFPKIQQPIFICHCRDRIVLYTLHLYLDCKYLINPSQFLVLIAEIAKISVHLGRGREPDWMHTSGPSDRSATRVINNRVLKIQNGMDFSIENLEALRELNETDTEDPTRED